MSSTTSPNATASATLPALASGPSPSTISFSCSGWREENMTGWPVLTNKAPSALPSRPAPIVAILGLSPPALCASAASGPAVNPDSAAPPASKVSVSRRFGLVCGVFPITDSQRLWSGTLYEGRGFGATAFSRRRRRRGSDMLGSEAHADEARRNARQQRHVIEQAQQPWRLDRLVRAEHRIDQPLLDHDLHRLSEAGRQGAALLDRRQMRVGQRPVAQRLGQDVAGGNGVLDRQVDAAPA